MSCLYSFFGLFGLFFPQLFVVLELMRFDTNQALDLTPIPRADRADPLS